MACLTRHCTLDVVVMLQPIVVVEITVGGVLACSSSGAQRFKRDFRVSYRVHKPLSNNACNRPLREMECNIHVKKVFVCVLACLCLLPDSTETDILGQCQYQKWPCETA